MIFSCVVYLMSADLQDELNLRISSYYKKFELVADCYQSLLAIMSREN